MDNEGDIPANNEEAISFLDPMSGKSTQAEGDDPSTLLDVFL